MSDKQRETAGYVRGLRVRPVTLSKANELVADLHRHHKPVRGHRFSLSVVDPDDCLRGVAICGRPVARGIDQERVVEATRVCTDGTANVPSMLYGAVCRTQKAMGFDHAMTYVLASEPGTSLRAAGWKPVAHVAGRSWDTPSRPRTDKHPTEDKIRWECRCSAAPSIDVEAAA